MPFNPNDVSTSYVIESFKNSIDKGEIKVKKTTTGGAGKKITIGATFGSINFPNGDILRISDGTTTIDYDAHANVENTSNTIAHSDDASDAVDQFVSKINTSALNITATDNGGNSSSASFTLVAGAGATITVTEDPTGDGQFGTSNSHCVIEDVAGGDVITELNFGPFRLSSHGVFNIRGQTTAKAYKTFLGEPKT